jgi:predicted Zn finger-like uncharacterized protein
MRIVCPACSATYDVPDSLLTAGRVVRCARCSGQWAPIAPVPAEPEPEAAEVEAEPEAEAESAETALAAEVPMVLAQPPAISAMDLLAMQPVQPGSPLRLRLAWAASLLLLVVLGWSAYAWRAQIVHAWPPSARIYLALGLQTDHAPPN